ncbi:hypothetical protein WA158_007966 [Blastocystis sp. Blastoise]
MKLSDKNSKTKSVLFEICVIVVLFNQSFLIMDNITINILCNNVTSPFTLDSGSYLSRLRLLISERIRCNQENIYFYKNDYLLEGDESLVNYGIRNNDTIKMVIQDLAFVRIYMLSFFYEDRFDTKLTINDVLASMNNSRLLVDMNVDLSKLIIMNHYSIKKLDTSLSDLYRNSDKSITIRFYYSTINTDIVRNFSRVYKSNLSLCLIHWTFGTIINTCYLPEDAKVQDLISTIQNNYNYDYTRYVVFFNDIRISYQNYLCQYDYIQGNFDIKLCVYLILDREDIPIYCTPETTVQMIIHYIYNNPSLTDFYRYPCLSLCLSDGTVLKSSETILSLFEKQQPDFYINMYIPRIDYDFQFDDCIESVYANIPALTIPPIPLLRDDDEEQLDQVTQENIRFLTEEEIKEEENRCQQTLKLISTKENIQEHTQTSKHGGRTIVLSRKPRKLIPLKQNPPPPAVILPLESENSIENELTQDSLSRGNTPIITENNDSPLETSNSPLFRVPIDIDNNQDYMNINDTQSTIQEDDILDSINIESPHGNINENNDVSVSTNSIPTSPSSSSTQSIPTTSSIVSLQNLHVNTKDIGVLNNTRPYSVTSTAAMTARVASPIVSLKNQSTSRIVSLPTLRHHSSSSSLATITPSPPVSTNKPGTGVFSFNSTSVSPQNTISNDPHSVTPTPSQLSQSETINTDSIPNNNSIIPSNLPITYCISYLNVLGKDTISIKVKGEITLKAVLYTLIQKKKYPSSMSINLYICGYKKNVEDTIESVMGQSLKLLTLQGVHYVLPTSNEFTMISTGFVTTKYETDPSLLNLRFNRGENLDNYFISYKVRSQFNLLNWMTENKISMNSIIFSEMKSDLIFIFKSPPGNEAIYKTIKAIYVSFAAIRADGYKILVTKIINNKLPSLSYISYNRSAGNELHRLFEQVVAQKPEFIIKENGKQVTPVRNIPPPEATKPVQKSIEIHYISSDEAKTTVQMKFTYYDCRQYFKYIKAGYFDNLEVLNASNCKIDDSLFKDLIIVLDSNHLNKLKDVDLSRNKITEIGIQFLYDVITQKYNPISAFSRSKNIIFANTKYLNLSCNTIKDAGVENFYQLVTKGYLKNLINLNIEFNYTSSRIFERCKKWNSCELLCFEYYLCSVISSDRHILEPFLTSLNVFKLQSIEINLPLDRDSTRLLCYMLEHNHLPNVYNLTFRKQILDEGSCRYLNTAFKDGNIIPKILCLDECTINEKDLTLLLENLPAGIQQLYLPNTVLKRSFVTYFGNAIKNTGNIFKNLILLDLSGTKLSCSNIIDVLTYASVGRLNLSHIILKNIGFNCRDSLKLLSYICTNYASTLVNITITGTQLDDRLFEYLRDLIPVAPKLTTMNFADSSDLTEKALQPFLVHLIGLNKKYNINVQNISKPIPGSIILKSLCNNTLINLII